ncbi:MAG: hypothetical protein PHF18_09800 [Methanosarcina sp.]|uniref:hypothetical protein n=1 Tax=Methanosarcina sp. TaxID=2213 RepID=UPI00262986FE|nr:hypothetical protein [Methanosarcina sp.]MDD3247124.1 hypothetical protein [Methanosarcina sp.]MDD4247678.1 hypothetical protein [Methanosarcina sp.]
MFDIFKSMIKEEWRMHSSLFGHSGFALFPVFIFLFTFFVSLVLPVFREIVTDAQIALGMHYIFLLVGGMVGAFGLLGREFMNRRFGQASLIAYSSRVLPVSERFIFANFLGKDVVYYFILYILPFVAGFALAAKFVPAGNFGASATLLTLLLTLSISFMIGISAIFFLSTVYAHSGKILLLCLLAASLLLLHISGNFNQGTLYSLPSLSFFLVPSENQLLLSGVLILVPSALSLIFLKIDFPQAQKSFSNSFSKLCRYLGSYRYAAFVAKDSLDLKRSEGGLGKLIFSFVLPLLLVWTLLSALGKVIPALSTLTLFALVLGVLSSSMYNWLTEYDIFSSYAFLPLKASDMIKSKLNSYLILNLVPLVILTLLALKKDPMFLIPSLTLFLTISLYMVSVLVYLTGLSPSINLYNGKIFALYMLSVMPLLMLNIILSMFGPYYALMDLLLIPVALYILGKGFRKWDRNECRCF